MDAPNTSESPEALSAPPAELAVSGMSCSNCVRHVTEAIRDVPAVAAVSVKLESGRATVKWKSSADLPAVIGAVKEAGFEASPIAPETPPTDPQKSWSPLEGWQFNVVVGLAAAVPLMVCEWAFHLGENGWFRWLSLLLALPVQIFCGARFYKGAWKQLLRWQSNMDTLVALGSTTAFGYSLWALFTGQPGHIYFMESASMITLISLGHWFEARTSARAQSSLQSLLRLAPRMARRRNADESETDVPVGELRPGDVVHLRPGDQIPADGEVVQGDSSVDQSMLTGESTPVDKDPGGKVFAGTINLNGRLYIRVTATGAATALAHIIEAVERAQSSRAEIQRIGDKVSSVFVPIVVAIALLTGLWWGFAPNAARQVSMALSEVLWPISLPATVIAAAIIHAAAVLIIACPCAMGLATPIAIMAGTNAAARRGILIRDGIALERAGRITSLVFDKTGTLTQGRPVVVNEEKYISGGRRPIVHEMKLAAALARPSNHPFSRAVAALYNESMPLTEWQEVRGCGVQARLKLSNFQSAPLTARLGSLKWLRESGVDVSRAKTFEEEWSAQGGTLVGVSLDGWLLGVLAIQDALKSGAASVVRDLQELGLNLYLVTGDNLVTAHAIAKQLGIPPKNVHAEVKPEDKARFIHDLRHKGERVAFVGDGINDAPALEAADLGIAVSSASDVAREAADIILLKSEIEAVPEALGLARATLRTIKQNLFWAFFYNAAGIPLAAMGFLSPVVCALAMGFSDIVVISNALRLLRWELFPIRRLGRRLAKDLAIPDLMDQN